MTIKVSYHAQMRFKQRINAVSHPEFGLLKMWSEGRNATKDDLELFGVKREKNKRYRVGRYGQGVGLVILRQYVNEDSWILTVIPL